MERQRLIKLIESKGTSSKEETNDLWDIVRKYPYFQTARLLLTKSFHDQSSIHFHDELKTTAAYAGDRKILFHLINDEEAKSKEESNVFVLEKDVEGEKDSFITPDIQFLENPFALSTQKEEYIEFYPPKEAAVAAIPKSTIREEKPPVKKEEKKPAVVESSKSSFDEPSTTQEDIIRRRLNEILSRNKPDDLVSKEKPQAAAPKAEELKSEEETPVTRSTLEELASAPKDEIEGLEIETIIEENYLQELEKLPEEVPPTPQRGEGALIESSPQSVSFIDWLKQKNQGRTTVEEVTDEVDITFSKEIEPEKHSVQIPPSGGRGALIDKFIETAPRIVATKAEFYSPSNMAKQSLVDNEDIISETLARIYMEQGNYLKARSYYERLSLLHPEKSASFAALIQKIDKLLIENG